MHQLAALRRAQQPPGGDHEHDARGGRGCLISRETVCSVIPSNAAIVRCFSPSALARRFTAPAPTIASPSLDLVNA
jgi:hypothetical protein